MCWTTFTSLTSTSVVVNFAGIVAAQIYAPYGQVRWSEGTMPTTYGFTGHHSDSATGLDYYNARYYDPTAGRFTSADTVLSGGGMDPAGFDRFAYVEDNPTTRMDSDGHCWPLCTMIIGAVVGAAIGAATSVVTQVASGQKVNWHEVAKQAVVGAVSGAISGLAGPEAGPLARAAIDAAASAGGQMVSNALSGKPVLDGVLDATVQGAAMSIGMGALVKVGGGLLKGAGKALNDKFAGTGLSDPFSRVIDTARRWTGTKVGQWGDLVDKNPTLSQLMDRLPSRAERQYFFTGGNYESGFKWTWDNEESQLYGHDNLRGPGWIFRHQRAGLGWLDDTGTFDLNGYDSDSAHIPMQPPPPEMLRNYVY